MLVTAAGQGDFGTASAQLGALFVPTLILMGLGFELKRVGGRLVAGMKQRWARVDGKEAVAVGA